MIDVTAARRSSGREGIRSHRGNLPPDEIAELDGIGMTTVARTVLDLAAVLDRHGLERALEQAEGLRLADRTPLAVLVSRYPGRRGIAGLRAILASEAEGAGVTRSELEERFLAFLGERGLPLPERNVWLALDDGWIEADCVWREQRIVAELDGYAYHATRQAFQRDRRRDRRLRLAGWEPVRITWWDLHFEADQLETDLAGLLALTSARHATP